MTGPNNWIVERGSEWAGGTRTRFAGRNADGELTFTFNGTFAQLIGSVPPSIQSQRLLVQVDDKPPYEASLAPVNYLLDGPYREWLVIPDMTAGKHVVRIGNAPPGLAVDFAVVHTTSEAAIQGKTAIVDNIDPAIQLGGTWMTNFPKISSDSDGFRPYGFSTYESSSQGDTALFGFSGTSISVFGRLNITAPMSVNFTIDNGVPEMAVFAPTNTGEVSPNFSWYSRQGLSSGSHTLQIDLVEPNRQAFSLDYLLYTADGTPPPAISPIRKPAARAPMSTIIGTIATVIALLIILSLVRRVRRRSSAKGIVKSTATPVDLDLELAPMNYDAMPRRAGPNAFARVHSNTASTPRPSLTPNPFHIPPSEWAVALPIGPSQNQKIPHPLYLEVQQPSTLDSTRRPSHTARQIGELYRAVQLLSEETQQLKGQLHVEKPKQTEGLDPPPYDDSLSFRPPPTPANGTSTSRLLTMPSPLSPPHSLAPHPEHRRNRAIPSSSSKARR